MRKSSEVFFAFVFVKILKEKDIKQTRIIKFMISILVSMTTIDNFDNYIDHLKESGKDNESGKYDKRGSNSSNDNNTSIDKPKTTDNDFKTNNKSGKDIDNFRYR